MVEMRVDILESEKVEAFDTVKWVKNQIDKVRREFGNEYDLSSIAMEISAGIPSGVAGSLSVTITPKEKKP